MSEPTQSEWVAAAVARFEAPLLRFTARLLRDPDAARDVVQDAFMRLCSQPRASVDGHLAEWLYTVCRNRALDVLRKESRMSDQPLVDRAPPDGAHSLEPEPGAAIEQREDAGSVRVALATLPPRTQEVLRLRFQEGLSYKEIAGVMQLTVSHVGVLIHNGLKSLRARLDARVA
jgi:RNA polymerase sigma-70 factor (ECF subfamily)